MHIAILGTRGIPNNYGGFEQCAEYLAVGLVKRGFDVSVYNSHNHPCQNKEWNGVNLIHCFNPENKIGTAGQFIYDLNCILDARKRNFDIILQLGYTSSSVWGPLLPKTIVTTNMDGFEWKRSKYSILVKVFLKYAEKLAIKYSKYWIADSLKMQDYLRQKYKISPVYIPYGADIFDTPDTAYLEKYQLLPYKYNMLIARLEPENSIEIILNGVMKANVKEPFIVIGNHATPYGEYLKNKFKACIEIMFLGGIYDITLLNNLRFYTNIYFHGHTVGGTNPSLLEAMSSQALICAHDNNFNSAILKSDALYFKTSEQVRDIIDGVQKGYYNDLRQNNVNKIKNIYSWNKIIDQYEHHFLEIYKANNTALNPELNSVSILQTVETRMSARSKV
jgi:glycosyltransferase involved in cell wall biosynthesis